MPSVSGQPLPAPWAWTTFRWSHPSAPDSRIPGLPGLWAVVTYGFTASHPDDNPALTNAHGTDESIGVASLMNSTRVMLALAYDVLAAR